MTEEIEDIDDAYALEPDLIDKVLRAVEEDSQSELLLAFDGLHDADIADLLEQLHTEDRRAVIRLWGDHLDAGVLSELEEGVRDKIMAEIPHDVLTHAIRDLETDDLVYLVEDLEDVQKSRILETLDGADRDAVEQSQQYDEHTAGRMMQREVVVAPQHWTVGDAIDNMRANDDLPEFFYEVIITDPLMHPVGTVALCALMGAARVTPLIDIMKEDYRPIPVDQSQEDVAYAFNQYNLVSAPVIDENNRLVGVITIDDAMEVLEDEAEEDMKRLAGLGDEELSSRVWEITKLRFPWLAVNLVTSILASLVIALFSDTIEAIVALAVLMPIVASMGGNAGTQSLTVAVRAIATRDLTSANAKRIVLRETLVGLVNGLVFALIIGIVGYVWFGSMMLGLVLALAMIANLLVAGMAGILIPISLDKLGADPALASGAFVTTVTDVVGFFAFLGLAAMLLL